MCRFRLWVGCSCPSLSMREGVRLLCLNLCRYFQPMHIVYKSSVTVITCQGAPGRLLLGPGPVPGSRSSSLLQRTPALRQSCNQVPLLLSL